MPLNTGPGSSRQCSDGKPLARDLFAGFQAGAWEREKDSRMGIEYKLQFAHSNPAGVASVLRRLPMVREMSGHTGEFELRAMETTGTMPDATAHIEPDGLYFCDHGGSGRQFLGIVIAQLVGEFGPVTVGDWE